MTFASLRTLLVEEYECDHACVIEADQVVDPMAPDCMSPAVHAFTRRSLGRQFVATVAVYHEDLPLPEKVIASVFRQLGLDT